MDIAKTLNLLESLLDEIPRLKTLHYKNAEFNHWDQRVKEILRETFGNKSNEYGRYNGIILLKYVHTEEDKQQAYIDCLNQREEALKSIIQTVNQKKSTCQKIWNECKDFITTIIAKLVAEKTKGA